MKWSTKIAMLYIGFAIMILGLAFASAQQDFQLVHKDYYAQELAYESRIQAIKNAKANPTLIEYKYPEMQLTFPEKVAAIQVHLYRPSDAKLDQKLNLEVEDRETLDLSELAAGRWQMRLTWEDSEKAYYQAFDFIVP